MASRLSRRLTLRSFPSLRSLFTTRPTKLRVIFIDELVEVFLFFGFEQLHGVYRFVVRVNVNVVGD